MCIRDRLDSYLPIIIPSLLAGDTYFVYMLIQFLRGIPKELEEAAEIDGCGIMQRLWYVIVPMLKPSIVSCALFQFMWASNDFMGPLIYVNTVAKYPVSIFLRMSMDADVGFEWNRVLAMSLDVYKRQMHGGLILDPDVPYTEYLKKENK